MKGRILKQFSTAAMAMAFAVILACASPSAYAAHTGHDGWQAISSGSRKTLDGGSYYLREDLSCDIIIKGQVELCLNGHTLTGSGSSSVITLAEGSSLSIHDCGKGGSITGGKATEGGGIYVGANASLELEGGSICGNEATRGGGIYAADSAQLSLTGGAISDNTAKSGGGVYLKCGASITGGTIKDNTASYSGGGIYSEAAGGNVLSISSGSIDGNSSLGHGGGIFIKNSQLDMTGGTISHNQTVDTYASGGGVYVGEYASFHMAPGAEITGNTSANDGGGICVSGGSQACDFTMTGGQITGNSALNGGGISTTGAGLFEINGGSITGNTSANDGGGVYVNFAYTKEVSKLISGCTIEDNTAVNYGGGVFIQGNSFIDVELRGDSVQGNTAMDGGGVYVNTLENLSLAGKLLINGNECTGRGTNLYLHSSETMSVSALEQGSDIGLSLEYTDKNTFTKDAAETVEMLKDCFTSNLPDFGVTVGTDKQLLFALACRVDFDAKGGSLPESYRMYTTGDELGQLPTPKKDGYIFAYWDYNGRRVTPTDPVTFDKTLTANYEFSEYFVHFDPNGGSGSMSGISCRYTVPFNLPECRFTKAGFVFKGWSLEPEGSAEYLNGGSACSLCKEPGGTVTLYAQWGMAPANALSMAGTLKLATGESKTISVTAEPAGADISDITWTSSNEKIVTVDNQGSLTGVSTGSAVITAETPAGATASCTVEVGRRSPEKADFVFSGENSFPYDGSGKAPELISYPEDMAFKVKYVRSEDGDESYNMPSEPGSYTIYLDVAESKKYLAASGITDSSWSFRITQGQQQELSIAGQPEAVYYGQAFTLYTEGGSGDGAVTWALTSGDSALINSETGDVYVSGTGDFTVTATKAGSAGFKDISASASFSVSKRQLYLDSQPTVAMEKVYDGTAAAIVQDMGLIRGFRPDDEGSIPVTATACYDSKNAGFDKVITVSYDLGEFALYYEAPEDTYIYGAAIYPMSAVIGWNYSDALVYNCGEQSVSAYVANALEGDSVSAVAYNGNTGIDVGEYTAQVTALDNSNYTLSGAEGNSLLWSIQPRTVTIIAADAQKVYGSEDPVFSYLCRDAEPPVLTGQLQRDYGEDTGAYTIRQGSLTLTDGPGFIASNYRMEFVEGLLTIDVAGNDIYSFSCADVPYGGQPMPYAQAAFGNVTYSYSQDPEGWFGPWDPNSAPGLWYVKASVEGTYNYNGAEAILPFTLLNEEVQGITAPGPVYVSPYGDVAANIANALPTQLSIVNDLGLVSAYSAQVLWDLSGVSYDPALPGAQALTVMGSVVLPEEVNNSYGVPLETCINIYVDPTVPNPNPW